MFSLHHLRTSKRKGDNMLGWIVTGAIAVPFIVMGIFLLNGKGAFLIAGYNTMGDDKRATYDEKALCRAVGILLLSMAGFGMLFPLAMYLEVQWLFWVAFIPFMVLPFGFAIYANTGNRFRINFDPNAPTTKAERKPMTRVKKAFLAIAIILSVQILIGTGIMFYRGERDPVVSVHGDVIRINASYGRDVNFSQISEITLIEESMREIGIGTRTNGYGGFGQALKGYFSSSEHGRQILYVYSGSSPTIMITPTAGTVIFISYRDPAETTAIYHELSAAFHSS